MRQGGNFARHRQSLSTSNLNNSQQGFRLLLVGCGCPVWILLLVCAFSSDVTAQERGRSLVFSSLEGRVVDAHTGSPLSEATVQLVSKDRAVATDGQGQFALHSLPMGTYRLRLRHVGYHRLDTTAVVDGRKPRLTFRLVPRSIVLDGVQVLAEHRDKRAGSIRLGQDAIEYVQPTSLRDLLLLLPGNVMSSNRFDRFATMSSRQVGSDDNTSLGTAFIMDDMPVSNDATRVQLAGLTGMDPTTDRYVADRTTSIRIRTNAGLDMRTISTDHIASVQFERGISSASEGNLSSGLVHIRSKSGVLPLQARVKLDPLNKLGYVGKGFALGRDAGTLYAGIDLLQNKTDVRELLESYLRTTLRLNYDRSFALPDRGRIDWAVRLLQTISIEDDKRDELQREYNESYRSSYARTMLSTSARASVGKSWLHSAEVVLSADYSLDLLSRKYFYLSDDGYRALPQALGEGEHMGIYLPTSYYCQYEVDNKPLYLNMRLRAKALPMRSESLSLGLHYGSDVGLMKNWGDGVRVDPKRPPYPGDNTFIRPRPNYSIPALGSWALFAEVNPAAVWGAHTLQLRVGLRASRLFNLPNIYTACAQWHAEPRINANWQYRAKQGGLSINLRLGYGREMKWPTLDLLYPDKLYRDFVVLNAFVGKPENSRLITYTMVHDPSNPAIRPNANDKYEMGLDVSLGGFDLSFTAFRERSHTGFDYSRAYHPVSFDRYVMLKAPISPGVVPNKEDYVQEHYHDFTILPTVMNAREVNKWGLEYRLRTPYLKGIHTQIELNGAYYHSSYSSSLPAMYRPAVQELGTLYPYVGIYRGGPHTHRSRLNTNIWINTKIPAFRLILTNFLQLIWRETVRLGREESELPYAYMGYDGKVIPVTAEEIGQAHQSGHLLRYLDREHTDLYHRATIKPVSLRLNFRGTKELSDKVRISFFVDNIINLNPRYKAADKTTERDWYEAFFGLETSIAL